MTRGRNTAKKTARFACCLPCGTTRIIPTSCCCPFPRHPHIRGKLPSKFRHWNSREPSFRTSNAAGLQSASAITISLGKSYHFDMTQTPRAKFSGIFLEEVRKAFAPFLAAGRARVDRTRVRIWVSPQRFGDLLPIPSAHSWYPQRLCW